MLFAKRLLNKFFMCIIACCIFVFGGVVKAHAIDCNANEINTGSTCETSKFEVTTTNLSAGDTFQFNMSARGTFYVDCGDGGTLSGTGVSGNTITRSDTSNATYTCTYETGGAKTIYFGGVATRYSNGTGINAAAIRFGISYANREKLASISGSLGAIFPTLGNSALTQPKFYSTFNGCGHLTSIPSELFSGVSGAASYMFAGTFNGCYNITSIPSTLFSGVSGAADYMFNATFSGCTGLTSIPSNLFSGVSGASNSLFSNTFSGCKRLTSIPSTLFSGVSGSAQSIFNSTFNGCTGLTSVPSGLFSGISGAASSMFASTFFGCYNITSIPGNLFSGVSGAAYNMFGSTFHGCTGLTSIPGNLFSGVSGAAQSMFLDTFYGCTGLTSIPGSLFSGVYGASESMFANAFSGCTGLTSIPSNLFSGISGFGNSMFNYTFSGCTGLVSIPEDLFSGVTGAITSEFYGTFDGCTNLSGYIPASTFAGLINAGGPTIDAMWGDTFNGTQLLTSCPSGTTDVTPENYRGTDNDNGTTWNGKVACQPDTPAVSVPGSEITSPVINSNIDVASTSYVMGAHRDAVNTAIEYVNAENTRAIAAEGILSNLTTTNKSSLVAAINEVKSTASNATDSYKDLSNLSAAGNAVIDERVTTNGSNGTFNAGQNTDLSSNTLGAAVNELASDYKNADTTINNKIGNTPLTTTSQTLTGAIEEVKDIAENASDIDAENSEFTADANSNISASTIGGAINELASDYQNADTTINNTIGNTPLTTTSQTLTGAIEEVNTTAADATSDANDVTSAMNSADVTLYTTWGDETNGTANINSMTGE